MMGVESEYTPKQVAGICGVSVDTVYAWIHNVDDRRRLEAIDRSGGAEEPRWKITQAMLEDFDARRKEHRPRRARGARIKTTAIASLSR